MIYKRLFLTTALILSLFAFGAKGSLAQECSLVKGCYRPDAEITGPDCSCPWIEGGNNSNCELGNCPVTTPTPTLTPTPTPTSTPIAREKKVIIIPGLGESWNYDALVKGKQVTDDKWELMSMIKDDFAFIEKVFTDRGFIKGKNLFVWAYDWRQPVNTIVGKLGDFVNKNIGDEEELIIVGHSLGGLTARIWGQDNYMDGRIGKIITLGSPHQGSVRAYLSWQYGKVSENNDFGNIVLKTFIKLRQSQNKKTTIEALREFSPVVKDLIPTFEFLKKDGQILPLNNVSYVSNIYLKQKNQSWNLIADRVYSVSGGNKSTLEYISLNNNVSYEYGNGGDGIVLNRSSVMPNTSTAFISKTHHMELVKRSDRVINDILDYNYPNLNLEGNEVEQKAKLVFFIASPAYLTVKCDNSPIWISNNQGFLIQDYLNYDMCKVQVVGTGNGTFELVMGKSDVDEGWTYNKNWISRNQKINYTFYPKKMGQKVILQPQSLLVSPKIVVSGPKPTPIPQKCSYIRTASGRYEYVCVTSRW